MKLPKRRRLEAKTDYKSRLALLQSGMPRLVVRKSNRYMTAQIVKSELAQDKVIAGATSKILLSKGWPKEMSGSLKSLPAAYLLGLVIGKFAVKAGIKKAILDIGMNRNIKNSRLYALLKGALDAGMEISCGKDVLPSMEIIKNTKIKELFDKIAAEI
jgi:large subunit ribosomal protein L18